jgi:PAS domain S-box-containing protein
MTTPAPGAALPATLLDASPDGSLAVDRGHRVTAWNPAMERLTGIPAGRALGHVLHELVPALAEERALVERALAGEACVAGPDRVFPALPGGEARWGEARYAPLCDGDGAVVGAVAVVRDVTLRHADAGAGDARAALRESEERFRALADTAPVLIWMSDTANLGTYFNRPWLEFTGRSLEEELGTGWLESVHPDDRERAGAYCMARFHARQEFRMEFRLRRADGAWRWVLDHGIPRHDAGGAFLGYIGSCIDITERKEDERALALSEERYRSLVEASTQMVWSTDAAGRVDDMPFWRELTGQTRGEVRGFGWAGALHPDDRPRVVAAWEAAHRTRGTYEAEYRLRMKDGSYRWFAARAVPVLEPGGEVREWVGIFNDVHDRRVAEAALAEREERYRLATRATRDVVWDWDLATDAVRWNEAISEVMGHPASAVEPTARWWYDQIHPGDRDRVVHDLHAAIRARAEGWSGEYRFARAGGGYAHVFDRGYLLRGPDGRPVRMIGAMQDVSERKRAEAARESERERLRRVLAQLPAAVAVYEGAEHVFVATSERYHRIVGGRDVLGRPIREALPELAAQGFDRLLDRVYATGEAYVGTGVRADWDDDGDGRIEEHVIDFVYQPLRDAAGAVYGVVAHVTDVTERHRAGAELAEARRLAEERAAEAARLAVRLQEQAEELRMQVEESVGLTEELRAANEGLLAASERAESGRRRIELLAQASSRLAASLDYAETVRTVARLAVPELADWCFVEVQDEPGAPIRLLAAAHADPEKVELAFRVLRRFPIRPDDPHGTAKVLRTGEPELVPEIPPEFLELLGHDDEHRSILHEVAFRSSVSVPLTVAGRTFGVLSLVMAESGRRYGADDLPLARELAHRAAVAIENARLYEEALSANQAKAGFLATMSHELRTPLNAMIGYVDLLLLGVPEEIPAAARGQVERIRLASRHLLSIIEEILAFSRLEAGRETVEPEAVELGAVVGEVSAIIEPLAAGKGLIFRVPERVESERIVTDPRKLRQILVNLLGNAVKFTREGSVSFEVERDGGHVLLHVRDTGIGIDPRWQELIFEPFHQVDAAKTRSAGGTGLGLSVSRRLARLLGGDVTVESEPGRGSTFTVWLPAEG